MNHIFDCIWIGGENDAEYPENIDAIITICDIETKKPPPGWPGVRIVIYQPDEAPIRKTSLTFFVRILDHLDKCDFRKILVHCREGRSRSPVFMAAYLMQQHNHITDKYFTFDQAINVIKSKRPEIKTPNEVMKQSVVDWNFGFCG